MAALLCLLSVGLPTQISHPRRAGATKAVEVHSRSASFPADASVCVCGSGGTHTHTRSSYFYNRVIKLAHGAVELRSNLEA